MGLDANILINGLITYLCFIPILTFHEFAHAWTAWKCGDDTARRLGRVSLNPAVHIDPIGTIVLPLLVVFLSASGSHGLASFIIGWGKPVPVNLANLNRPRRDDTLVALAGPAMNVVLALALVILGKGGQLLGASLVTGLFLHVAVLSLFLCFFNLLPIPPLDGSHVVKNAIGMSDETYWRLCQFGFIGVIIAIQFDAVRALLSWTTYASFGVMSALVGLKLPGSPL
jgi:Zn-dependent protease